MPAREKRDPRVSTLLVFAAQEKRGELQAALTLLENRSALPEAMELFESLGDEDMQSRMFADAVDSYRVAFDCATICTLPSERIQAKAAAASQQLELEQQAALNPRPPIEPEIRIGNLFKRLADLALSKKTAKWHRLVHDRKYAHASVHRRITDHFEALGDARRDRGEWSEALAFYGVANFAIVEVNYNQRRISDKVIEAEKALLADRLAHPVLDGRTPEPLDWDHGLEWAEVLVLSGRAPVADALLQRLRSVSDDYGDRTISWSGRCEWLGDQLAAEHPRKALWFCRIAVNWFGDWVAGSTSGGEGVARSRMEQTAPDKLLAVQRRLVGGA